VSDVSVFLLEMSSICALHTAMPVAGPVDRRRAGYHLMRRQPKQGEQDEDF
jgi:hypothetical protein